MCYFSTWNWCMTQEYLPSHHKTKKQTMKVLENSKPGLQYEVQQLG